MTHEIERKTTSYCSLIKLSHYHWIINIIWRLVYLNPDTVRKFEVHQRFARNSYFFIIFLCLWQWSSEQINSIAKCKIRNPSEPLILWRIRSNILQSTSDGLWDGGRGRQMGALGHISIHIIRGISNRVHHSIVPGITRRSLGNNHILSIFAGGLLQRSSLLHFNSVSSLESAQFKLNKLFSAGAW